MTEYPGQIPILADDQPLYALAKEIQRTWPDWYGESKFVIMFGGLYIQMASFMMVEAFARQWME